MKELTTREVMAKYSLPRKTLYRWVELGMIEPKRNDEGRLMWPLEDLPSRPGIPMAAAGLWSRYMVADRYDVSMEQVSLWVRDGLLTDRKAGKRFSWTPGDLMRFERLSGYHLIGGRWRRLTSLAIKGEREACFSCRSGADCGLCVVGRRHER